VEKQVPADDPIVRPERYHPIDDYLSEDWLDQWTRDGIGTIELYLATFSAPADFTDAPPTLGLDES
jgi:hypothetical protein